MALQQPTRLSFGSGQVFGIPPGSLYPYLYGDVTEAQVEFKEEVKKAWGEGSWPSDVAVGHKEANISLKWRTWSIAQLALDSVAPAPSTSSNPWQIDEVGVVNSTSQYPLQLGGGGLYIPGTLSLRVQRYLGSIPYVRQYNITSVGAEVTGVAASITTSTGVVNFAAGEVGNALKATYSFVNSSTGQIFTVAQNFQNSDTVSLLKFIHRDISPEDSSTAETIWTFNRVKRSGFKFPYKEGDHMIVEASFEAMQDAFGNVWSCEFINK
jgi:hypothetical protein